MAHQSAHWPHDEDDPPVGVSIRPLRQLPDLPASAPMLPAGAPNASWERGSSFGTPGASAIAHYQRARTSEWARFTRSLPWRLASVVAAGALVGTLTHSPGPRLAGPAAALAAAVVGWRLRFRVSAETTAWRRGARGEQRTARHLNKLVRAGWTVLHDLAIPASRANGDHLLIGPPGVFLIDTKPGTAPSPSRSTGPPGTTATHSTRPSPPSGGRHSSSPARSARQSCRCCASTTPAFPGMRSTWTTCRCSPTAGCWRCCGLCRRTWTRLG